MSTHMIGGSARTTFSCTAGWSEDMDETYHICSTRNEVYGDAHHEISSRRGYEMQRRHDDVCDCGEPIDCVIELMSVNYEEEED